MKPTKRKAFNFLRSYFDVLNHLENDADKLSFLLSIINKQFLDEDPKDLNFIVKLCYDSQRHSIEKSVKGWKIASSTDLIGNPLAPPTLPKGLPLTPPKGLPKQEEQVQEEEQEKEEITIGNSDVDIFEVYKNQIAEEMKNPTEWRNSFYRLYNLKDNSLSKVMDDFILQRKSFPDDPPKNLREFKRHFSNWCIKVDPIGKLNSYKKHQPKEKGSL